MNQECINKWLLFADRSHFFQSEKQINAALEYSEHKLRSRSLLSMLTNGKLFVKEKGFEELFNQVGIEMFATKLQGKCRTFAA